jgi:uncharacterized lipoprotein
MTGHIKTSLLVLVLLGLSACGVSGVPEGVMEDYFNAVAAGDAVRAANLSCADWEDRARMDADSFMNVETTIEEMHCSVVSETESTVDVWCSGYIVADYQGENLTIDLSLQVYRLIAEDGVWRVCGTP